MAQVSYSKETVVISQDHYGRDIGFDVHRYDSGISGPDIYVQSSVHGSELQGNLVIERLLQLMETHRWCGSITLVPFANPWSAHNHFGSGTYGRFDAVTGRNWNRGYHMIGDKECLSAFLDNHNPEDDDFIQSFRTFLGEQLNKQVEPNRLYGFQRGKRLTYELQKLSHTADIVLDLHTAGIAGLYIYAPEYLQNEVNDFSFPVNLIIPNAFDGAGDEAHFAPWTLLQEICNERGLSIDIPVEAYTVELGSEEIVSESLANDQTRHIAQYLFRRGFFLDNPCTNDLPAGLYQNLDNYKTYHSERACLCDYLVKSGQQVSKGDVLAKLFTRNTDGTSKTQLLLAQEDSVVVNHASTSNLQAGTEVFQLLEHPKQYNS